MSTTEAGVVASPAGEESRTPSTCSSREVNADSIETSSAECVSAFSRRERLRLALRRSLAPAVAAASTSRDGTDGVGSFGASSSDAPGGASPVVFVDASADAVGGTSGIPLRRRLASTRHVGAGKRLSIRVSRRRRRPADRAWARRRGRARRAWLGHGRRRAVSPWRSRCRRQGERRRRRSRRERYVNGRTWHGGNRKVEIERSLLFDDRSGRAGRLERDDGSSRFARRRS